MADLSSSASRRQLSVTTPSQISKGGQGSENLIPLSPQWLLPKPGESKTGMLTGEKPPSPNPSFCSRLDTMKSSGNGDEIRDTQKKDVFRPSLMDMEAGGHRERWRDEERDTNSSGRKDRWRDGDKEIGDTRKMDRWMENSSAKQFGEARRAPLERWTDSSNKESNYEQRRENKWNMRWGPNDKEAEGFQIRDTQKMDVFSPSLMDMEAGGRRERWRDEERDTNSSGRKDRWRDGDKEIGDTRRMDRWMENSSAKQFGEARRAPLERWTDSSNKESNYEQRRENKWNMRWGPNDKEAEGFQIRDTQKMDVFSPSLMDMEAGGRRERWRDEERDTNSSGRKDRWRDGDKEIGDTRRMDRWMENSSAKQFGEARRAPLERWTDSSNKESNYEQRRENKWNTRWGPNDKEAEG